MPTCEWCGDAFERPSNRGPTPKYCSNAHRQRAFEGRRRWAERAAVRTYVEAAESFLCAELHLDEWPDCDDPGHDEGRRLLEALDP